MSYTKPLPAIDQWNKPFWDACKEHKLIAQRCDVSGAIWFPPGPISPVTRDTKWSWIELSGYGKVSSWVMMHQRYFPGFANDLPYNIVQVQLDEGPTIIANMADLKDHDIKVGMRVKVVFDDVTGEFSLPKFARADGENT
jgi:uncharacterized OB-fold protein